MALLIIIGLLIPASVTAVTTARAVTTAPAGDGLPGFWWGTDSLPVTVPGSAPYQMPYLGGAYGGYIGMSGNWAYWLGCAGQEYFIALSRPTMRRSRLPVPDGSRLAGMRRAVRAAMLEPMARSRVAAGGR